MRVGAWSRRGWLLGWLSVAMAMVASVGPLRPAAAQAPAFPVEARYAAPGPHPVATGTISEGGRARFQLYYPDDLGADGALHPIVTWGNGSDATPAQYDALLRHLASWGIVVIAATTTGAGDGAEILAAARHAVAAHDDPSSPLHGHLDVSSVGAVGHSQGAGGSVRASTMSDGLITTTVPISLPARLWVTPGMNHEFAPAQLRGSVLFLSGSDDIIISAGFVNRGYYDEAPEPAAMAMRRGAGHLEPAGDGDGFRGYLTAWLRYQLVGDADAAAAFTGDDPELRRNTGWSRQAMKGLVAPMSAEVVAPASTVPAPEPAAPEGSSTPPVPPTSPASASERLPATGGPVSAGALGLATVALLVGLVGWHTTQRR